MSLVARFFGYTWRAAIFCHCQTPIDERMFWPASFGSFGKSKLENFRPLPLIKLPGGRSIDRAAARTSSGAIDLAFGSTSLNNVHNAANEATAWPAGTRR